jgi:heat shock protein HslJ
LTSFKSGVLELPVIPFTKITLFFKPDGTGVYGNSGVNLYGAKCVLSGDSIILSDMVTTLMSRLLPPGVSQQEDLYLKLLRNSEIVSVSENRLVIHCSGGELRYSGDEVYEYP